MPLITNQVLHSVVWDFLLRHRNSNLPSSNQWVVLRQPTNSNTQDHKWSNHSYSQRLLHYCRYPLGMVSAHKILFKSMLIVVNKYSKLKLLKHDHAIFSPSLRLSPAAQPSKHLKTLRFVKLKDFYVVRYWHKCSICLPASQYPPAVQ